MSVEIKVGQKLKTLNGDYATVELVGENFIIVSYHGKEWRKDKDIIGKKLFIDEELNHSNAGLGLSSDDVLIKKTCKNCLLMRSDKCFNGKKVCESFQDAPSLSKLEIGQWPKIADATRFRRTGKRR